MAGRQDALRNFYRRRQIEKKKKEQPLIIDDNAASDDDRLSIEAIRNIYIDPEEVDGTAIPLAENQITGEVEAKLSDKEKGGDPSKDAADAIIKSIQGMAEMPNDEKDEL